VAEYFALKDAHLESRLFRARLIWLVGAIAFMTVILISRYFTLQVIRYDDFATRSDANRILSQVTPPPRGLIFDREGVLLANSRASFSLNIVRERTENLEKTLKDLQDLIPVTPDQIERFHKSFKKRGRRPYESMPLRYQLTDEEIAIIAVNEWRLPGVDVVAQLVRHYPLGHLTAHNIGYMGSINDDDLIKLEKDDKLQLYEGVYSIGKLGLERIYEDALFGVPGARHVEVNARGQVLREIGKEAPQAGKNFHLFLDKELQQLTTDKLGEQRGGVVAIEIKTGGVVTAVSTPAFNPNLFVTGIALKDYNALQENWQLPLFNRILQGQYPPGSTLKAVLGLAGLEEKVITPAYSIYDPGFFQLPGDKRQYRDWKREGHGSKVNLNQAIAESCDTYFYRLGHQLGVRRITPYYSSFGVGQKTGVDLTYERGGILPTPEWKKGRSGLPWFPGDTINISIGQGDMLVTPMQLAYATSVIASRGKRIVPRMVERIEDQYTQPQELPLLQLKDEKNWDHIIQGMVDVVHGPRGTASHLSRNITYRMAGKTGTAQVIGIKQNEKYDAKLVALRNRDHALFIAFAPVEDPQIAVAVIIENGESGSSAAAPVAKALIDAYLAKQPAVSSADAP
jgi:penicillin-binding protein 2